MGLQRLCEPGCCRRRKRSGRRLGFGGDLGEFAQKAIWMGCLCINTSAGDEVSERGHVFCRALAGASASAAQ